MTITICTPWLHHPELWPAYKDAIEKAQPDAVVIVNNGVTESGWSEGITDRSVFIWTGVDLGFNRACNRGLAHAHTDAVLFLNNDIVATSSDWLDGIREDLRPGVLCGASLRGTPQHPAPHGMVDGRHMPYLEGWCLAGMTHDLRLLGGWDEELEEPAYYGDNLLCAKARLSGMRLVESPVGLRHLGGITRKDFGVMPDEVAGHNREIYRRKVRELLAAKKVEA